jgi:hypothetical protein
MRTKPEPRTLGTLRSMPKGRKGTIVQRASKAIELGLSTVRMLASHVPGTAHVIGVAANATTSGLQTLPNSTLRGLAASSAGLGAGFYFAGGPRLVTVAAVAPAMIIGAAIIMRPEDKFSAPEAAR